MDVPLAEDREFAMLDAGQVSILKAVERMGATLSLFGIMLIFITFALFKRLRTIPNTFIFFASVANVGACVACLIAYDGIQAMNLDRNAALCQAQGFLFEWFMQSDPWWSFAMAVNVYMVFFMSFNPTTFRQYLWIYCVICFGLPAIPAFVFLFVRGERGLVYGDAALWCWISSDWNSLRIYSYYLPIWVCTVLSAIIYFAIGYHVFHQRNQLRNLSLSNQAKDDEDVICDASDVRDSAEKVCYIYSLAYRYSRRVPFILCPCFPQRALEMEPAFALYGPLPAPTRLGEYSKLEKTSEKEEVQHVTISTGVPW